MVTMLKLCSNKIIITDEQIIQYIRSFNIKTFNYYITKDSDGVEVVVFCNDNRSALTQIKFIDEGNVIYFRTPTFLRKCINNKIVIYKEYIHNNNNELFRIRPIDFKFSSSSKIHKYDDPYFTKSGLFVIPILYYNHFLSPGCYAARLSFGEITEKMINAGIIYISIQFNKSGTLNYPLYPCNIGLTTDTTNGLVEYINKFRKQIYNFKYLYTIEDPYNKYGKIIMKECS